MPYYESPYKSGTWRYYDPIKIREESGLSRIVREPLEFYLRGRLLDKYDVFAEYPFLERVDYNRLVFETYHGIKQRNDEQHAEWTKKHDIEYEEYCCWPIGCVLNAAMGSTLHWTWRRAFEKQLPYWNIRDTDVK